MKLAQTETSFNILNTSSPSNDGFFKKVKLNYDLFGLSLIKVAAFFDSSLWWRKVCMAVVTHPR